LAGVTLLALWMRVLTIDVDSLWIDETASWSFSQLPLAELWGRVPDYEPHPPLYYTVLKFWGSLFGHEESALRSFSVVTGTLTTVFVFLIGRTLLTGRDGFWLALIAATVIALHPVQIHYAQETRAYGPMTLGVAMLLLALVWWLVHPEALSSSLTRQFRTASVSGWLAMAFFVFGSAWAIWMHHTAILLVGSVIGVGALLVLSAADRRGWRLINLLSFAGMILLLWLPGFLLLIHSFRQVDSYYWVTRPSLREIVDRVDYLIGSLNITHTALQQLVVISVVALIALAGAAALVRRMRWRAAALFCAAAVLPILASVAASLLVTPILVPRTLVFVQIGLALLVGAAVLWLPTAGRVASLVAVALLMTAVAPIARLPREPWREVVQLLEEEARPQDIVITWPVYSQIPLNYYQAGTRVSAQRVRVWPGNGSFPTMAEVFDSDEQLSDDEVLARVRAAEVEGAVWVVTRGSEQMPVIAGTRAYFDAMRGPPRVRLDFAVAGRQDPPFRVLEYPAIVDQ
jgi:uncharacterized membrane protein